MRLLGWLRTLRAPPMAERARALPAPPIPAPPPEPVPTRLQKDTIEAIVSIFETGRLPGLLAYSSVVLLPDGAGVSYGLHQATARSGALPAVIEAYYERGGRLFIWSLSDALMVAKSSVGMAPSAVTPGVQELMRLLRLAGSDQRMQDAQDEVFDARYWQPALSYARALKLELPLSYLAVFDLWIHSGPEVIAMLRRRFPELPPVRGGDERAWTGALIRERHAWLSGHSSPTIRKTSYRTASLLALVAEGRWDLARPLTVRGQTIE